MEADLYPPDVVMLHAPIGGGLSRVRSSTGSEASYESQNSPLSSTPASPRGEHDSSCEDEDDEDEDYDNEKIAPEILFPKEAEILRPKRSSEAPFDERVLGAGLMTARLEDEKKTADETNDAADDNDEEPPSLGLPRFGGDEVLMMSKHRKSNTFHSEVDGDVVDAGEPPSLSPNDDAGQPPSLSNFNDHSHDEPEPALPPSTLAIPEIAKREMMDEDEDEPPSLSNHNKLVVVGADQSPSPQLRPETASSTLKGSIQKPSMIRQRATTTGGINTNRRSSTGRIDDIAQKYLKQSPTNQATNTAAPVPTFGLHKRKISIDMQQKIRFAALKRELSTNSAITNNSDIDDKHNNRQQHPLLPPSSSQQQQVQAVDGDDNDDELFNTTIATASATRLTCTQPVAVTPDPDLLSPPKVIKKQQMWNDDTTADLTSFENLSMNQRGLHHHNLVSPIRPTYSQGTTPDAKSYGTQYPSFYNDSYEAEKSYETTETAEETGDIPVRSLQPKTNFNMISPNRPDAEVYDDGDIPLPTTSTSKSSSPARMIDSDNAYDDHKHGNPMVYSEEEMAKLVRGSAGSSSSISKVLTYGHHVKDDDNDDQPDDEKWEHHYPTRDDDQPDDEQVSWGLPRRRPPPSSFDQDSPSRDDAIQSPFHPQGSIRISRGKGDSAEQQQRQEQTDHWEEPMEDIIAIQQPTQNELNDVTSMFASVVSDAASALSNASSGFISSDVACFAPTDPTGLLCDDSLGADKRMSDKTTQVVLAQAMRKVDVPLRPKASSDVSTRKKDGVHPEARDWMNYLQQKGVGSKSKNTRSSVLRSDWTKNNKNGKEERDEDNNSLLEKELASISTISEMENGKRTSKNQTSYAHSSYMAKKDPEVSARSEAWMEQVQTQLGLMDKKDTTISAKSEAWMDQVKAQLGLTSEATAPSNSRAKAETQPSRGINVEKETPNSFAKNQFANALTKKLEQLQSEDTDNYLSGTDEEVAALTIENGITPSSTRADDAGTLEKNTRNVAGGQEAMNLGSQRVEDGYNPVARRLDFNGGQDYRERSRSALGVTAPTHYSADVRTSQKPLGMTFSSNDHPKDGHVGRTNPVGRSADRLGPDDERGPLDISLQATMQRVVSNTRAALREDFPSGNQSERNINGGSNLLHSPFRSLAVTAPDTPGSQKDLPAHPLQSVTDNPTVNSTTHQNLSRRSASEGGPNLGSSSRDYSDMHSKTPALIQSMDCAYGIAKGDITLSLLNENTGQNSPQATWASRVHGAIWRCRRMRRKMGGFGRTESNSPTSPLHGRTSVPVDMDKARGGGEGFSSVASTQSAALNHLRFDQIDKAIELFEDIIFAYYSYFEKTLKARELNPGLSENANGTTDFKPYIGVALHNLGVLHLLSGHYEEALSFFSRAVENRKVCLGEGHRDHVVSDGTLAFSNVHC